VISRGRRTRLRSVALLAIAGIVLLGATLFVGARLVTNHQNFGVFAWSVTSPTPKVTFNGRVYHRAEQAIALPDDAGRVGAKPDGRQIWASSRAGGTPTGLFVEMSPTTYVYYTMSGSP
jgi:hypothetical protein